MTFRIATYNVLAQSFVRPDRYPHSSPDALDPSTRRALLIGTIRAMEADVLALQEVELDLYQAVLDALGPGWHGAFERRHGKPDGCALLARVPLAAPTFHHHELGRGRGRMSTSAVLELEGRQVGVVSTHLQWARPGASHPGRAQLVSLLDALDPGLPWLVCGDFNANSQSDVLQAAFDRGWALSCRSQRPWDTTNINGRRRKLDYILYKRDQFVPTPGTLPRLERNTPMPSADYASDHLPVVVDFSAIG